MTTTDSTTTTARAPGTVPALVGCPFCGSSHVRHVRTSLKYERDEWRRVKCDDCGAYGPIKDNEPEAKAAWNRRAPKPGVSGQLARKEPMTTPKNDAGQAVRSTPLLGIGVRIIPEEHAVMLLFEVEGMAQTLDGKPAPAGMSMKMNLKAGATIKDVSHYEACAASAAAKGWADMGIQPGQARPISWDYYCEQGYNDED